MGGFLPVPGQSLYGASKAAVKLQTEALYAELMETNVNVSVIFPGAIATDIANNSGVAVAGAEESNGRQMTSAEDAARTIIEGIERDQYRILIGSDAKMMDKLYRLMPKRAVSIIYNQMKDLLSRNN
jgi:short-subunit dehydrogenase